SIHAEENELVVQKALASDIAKEKGWKILRRENQIRGMREWPVRGSVEACDGDEVVTEGCIRANKGDEHATMGFFLAGFIQQEPQDLSLEDGEEWGGFEEEVAPIIKEKKETQAPPIEKKEKAKVNKHAHNAIKKRVSMSVKDKKRQKTKR
ncbi:hypothetical protein DID88_006898, partial [Monilinia fructigena]